MNKRKITKRILSILAIVVLFVQPITCYGLSPTKCVDITGMEISYVGGACNNVMKISYADGDVKYFKPVKKHLSDNDEVKRIVNEYFTEINPTCSDSCATIILNKLANKDNFKKFINMIPAWDANSNYCKFMSTKDPCYIGIPNPISKELEEVLPDFATYAVRELKVYQMNSEKKIGEFEDIWAVRNIATKRMADLFDVSDLIVNTWYVTLRYNGKADQIGIFMDAAKGIDPWSFKHSDDKRISSTFQKNCASLYILDSVCKSTDRMHGNLNVCLDSAGCAYNLSAYDSDYTFWGWSSDDLKEQITNKAPIIRGSGRLNLPHMDRALAARILSLSDNEIRKALSDLLTDSEINATIDRVNQLKSAIIISLRNPKFLLNSDEWNSHTFKQELTGNYGETYLKYFINYSNIKFLDENSNYNLKIYDDNKENNSPLKNGTYSICSAIDNNMVLDIYGCSLEDKANLQLYEFNNTDAQKFILKNIGDGYYTIQSKASKKMIDVADGSMDNMTNVWQYSSNDTDAQKWLIRPAGDGYFYVISKCNGLYLDVTGASSCNKTNIQVYYPNLTIAQKFKFNAID